MEYRYHFREPEIKCPHCDYTYTDSWDYGPNDETTWTTVCKNCEKAFEVSREIETSYTTRVV